MSYTKNVNPAMEIQAVDSAEDESDELFSDDEEKGKIKRRLDVSEDASVLSRSETPLSLFDSSNTIMPTVIPSTTDAVIPSTPLSLVPFLNKINDQWTSDLETPQAQTRTKSITSSTGRTEETPKVEQRTPDVSTVKSVDKIISNSPVINSKASRRRSKRRIFRSSISINPLAVTNNEDITVNAQVETPVTSDANSVVQHDATSAAISDPSLESALKDCKSEVLDRNQDRCNNEETGDFTNAVSDNLSTSTQEFFSNVSFSKIDELCSNTFDNQKATETTAAQYYNEQNIENINKGKNVVENKNVGFFTARGTSINVSKQALFKAKKLFADAFDTDETQNYESFGQRNFNEENNRLLPSSSFANNVSANTAKEALSKPKPITEQSKDYNKVYTTLDCKKSFVNKSPSEEVNKVPVLFSTASGNPINISREALLKAKTLLANDLDDADDNTLIKYYDRSDKNPMTVKNMTLSSSAINDKSINIFKKSPSKVRTLSAGQSDTTIEFTAKNKIDVSNAQCDINTSNIGFRISRDTLVNSEQVNSKPRALFAEQLNDSLDSVAIEEIYNNDNEIKRQEAKVPKIGFQTACGKAINVSERALSKAKALFAEHLDDTLKAVVAEETDIHDNKEKELEVKLSNIRFQSIGSAVDISEERSKAKMSFKQLDDQSKSVITRANKIDAKIENRQELKIPSIGFQTALGTSINISEKALSRAKALFAEHLDDTLKAVAEETNIHDNKEKGLEVKVSNIRFQSIGGAVDISKERSKAKVSFEQLNDQSESVMAKANKIDDKVENRQIKIPSIGFQTAHGTSISISEEALSRAKALFADQLDCPFGMDVLENPGLDDGRKIKERDLTIPHGGLQTASGQQVPVSNNAALMARESFSNVCPDESNPDLGRASLQKRKLSATNADESTPLGRNHASETKKARFSSEFQARKLFPDKPSVDANNVENRDPDVTKQAPFVADSALGSPKRDAGEPSESDASSPVIGRQSISKKRKSLGHQRNEQSALRADKRILNNENTAVQENVVEGSTACGNIEDNKLNTKTQRPTQVARIRAKTSSTESNDYGDTQVMMDFIDESTKILQERLAAALEQEAIITAKRRHGSKQLTGHLYRYKQINSNARLSLRKIAGDAPPAPRSCQELIDRQVSPRILEITAVTAATYKFRCSDFYGNDVAYSNVYGIEMEDGARLILDENGYAGVWEMLRAFLAGPGVDPNLVPARWVENHYRWIVWKLASMDRMKFGSAELPRALTPSNVMAQLKYRYDREIDRSQRPAIRRILEKDDVASKRMILCVSSIIENNNVSVEIGKSPRIGVPKWKIELTDGWYSINACIDIGMVRSISTGRVREGTKLVISGAELMNCDQGFHPLEVPADVCLKLHTNSTRRARWDTKLGYTPRSGPIPIRLRNVFPSGGLIGKMTIVVARVYPMLYHEKTTSGDSIVRNAKSEEKAQSKYEQQCWSKIEAFYAKAEDFQEKGLSCETDDMAIQLSEDYENLFTEESVSKKRHDELLQELRQKEERFKQRMQSKLRESLPGPRQVSQLLKVRVCDENANAILSVWSPSEDIVDALKEGACVSLCNVVASGKRGTELQLTARRSAIFKPGKMCEASYPARVCVSLCEITNSDFAPPYGEFDTVGVVCSVGPAPYGMKDFDAVHLAYCKATSSDSSYLSILFWQGIASYGYADILTVGSIIACSNLEWRRATSWNVPAAYCTERSTFTRNPRRNHLYESFENLRNLITDPTKYIERCSFELNVELQKKLTPTRYTTGKNTPIKLHNSMSSVDKKLVNYTSPLATPKLGTSGNSNFIASNSSIQKRLDKLQHYGEPPELSPIMFKKSKRTSLAFRSPIVDVNLTKQTSNVNQSEDLNLPSTTEKH